MRIISLRKSPSSAPLIPHETEIFIRAVLARGKKVLCIFNRRGALRTLSCKDCGMARNCPICGVGLVGHIQPSIRYICHHCQFTTHQLSECSHCHGTAIDGIGYGIQAIEAGMQKLFDQTKIVRIDSDSPIHTKAFLKEVDTAQILLSTDIGGSYWHDDIELKVLLNCAAELTYPHFSTEERVYRTIHLHHSNQCEVIIQTPDTESEFIHILAEGNYKDFLIWNLKHKKQFGYPPYQEYATVSLKKRSEGQVLQFQKEIADRFRSEGFTVWEPQQIRHTGLKDFTLELIVMAPSIREKLSEKLIRDITRNRDIEFRYEM